MQVLRCPTLRYTLDFESAIGQVEISCQMSAARLGLTLRPPFARGMKPCGNPPPAPSVDVVINLPGFEIQTVDLIRLVVNSAERIPREPRVLGGSTARSL